jgi:2-dehydro-3-deoxyglucarate aldolase/4-hydroxy-2-oxoheptanedioate aldolase
MVMIRSIRSKLAGGGRCHGSMVFEFFTPGIAQLCVTAGAEFVLFDMEHTGVSIETIRQQMACCRGLDIAPFVRVPSGDYHFVARALDCGAKGVMVPMVESAEQAATIVAAAKYPPAGRRGAAFGVAHDDFAGGDIGPKMAAANADNLVIVQIETERGAANVDAIAATPGVDVLWLGHFDMTNFLSIPGRFDDPRYLAAADGVVAAADRHSKVAGFLAADHEWARNYVARGFRMIAYGLDHLLFQRALADGIALLNSL